VAEQASTEKQQAIQKGKMREREWEGEKDQ